jgi:hypothetical protein
MPRRRRLQQTSLTKEKKATRTLVVLFFGVEADLKVKDATYQNKAKEWAEIARSGLAEGGSKWSWDDLSDDDQAAALHIVKDYIGNGKEVNARGFELRMTEAFRYQRRKIAESSEHDRDGVNNEPLRGDNGSLRGHNETLPSIHNLFDHMDSGNEMR